MNGKMVGQIKLVHIAGKKRKEYSYRLDQPKWFWTLIKFFLYGGMRMVLEGEK